MLWLLWLQSLQLSQVWFKMEAVIYIAALGGFYALVHYLNHKTPKPEGCEYIDAACTSCSVGICSNHPSQSLNKEDLVHVERS